MRCIARCRWVLVALVSALVVPTLSAQSDREVQQSIQKGGTNWSSPESTGSWLDVPPGDQVWLWPTADNVVTMSHGDPRLTLNWRWRTPRGGRPSTKTLSVSVIVTGGQGGMMFVFQSDGTVSGIDPDVDGGTCELVLNQFERQFSGDAHGTITMFLRDQGGPPLRSLSNLLRVKVHLVEGALDYRPAPTTDSWPRRQLALGARGVNVRFNPAGTSVAVTTEDGKIDMWDVNSGTLRGRSLFKIGRATEMRFNDAGDRLALWDPGEKRVVIADANTLQLDHEIELPESRFPVDVQFVPASARVAVTLVERKRVSRGLVTVQERGVFIWDRTTRAAVTTHGGDAGDPPMYEVSFSPDGRQMVSWFAQDVWLWNVGADERARRIALGNVIPIDIQFVDDVELFVMTGDGRALHWDLAAAVIRRQWSFAPVRFVSLRWPMLAVGDGNRDVVVWDARAGVRQSTAFTDHPDGASDAVLSNDGRTLLAGSSRSLTVWDVATHEAKARFTIDGPALPAEQWELAISPTGTAAAVTRHDRKMLLLWAQPAS
jgi:WD40 repeat protein